MLKTVGIRVNINFVENNAFENYNNSIIVIIDKYNQSVTLTDFEKVFTFNTF